MTTDKDITKIKRVAFFYDTQYSIEAAYHIWQHGRRCALVAVDVAE